MKTRLRVALGFLLLTFFSVAFSRAEIPVPAGGLFFGQPPDPAKSRHYYVAAEPTMWDYAPSGRDQMCGAPTPPSLQGDRQVGKIRYFQYTDATFTTRVVETPSLGILGPVLRGVVGDYLVVTFLNRTSQSLSMHPHGVKYDKDSEGAYYSPGAGKGASVAAGAAFTYVWQLDADSGPAAGEPSSKGWLYHSHVAGDDEINQGLIGVIIVTDPLRARPDGTPADVDRELATLFLIFDESGLGAEAKEAYEYVDNGSGIPVKRWADIQETLEIGSRTAINGRTFGNLSGLEMNEGEHVRWYLFGLGSQQDFHTAHWHGQRVLEDGRRRTDVIELLPASMKTADLIADNPGEWLFHCHVADHMAEGMFARLTVYPRDAVGADRTPEHAFLGLLGATQNASLSLSHGAVSIPVAATETQPARAGEIRLTGVATISEAFTLFRQKFTVKLGETSVTFAPDTTGQARVNGAAGGQLRITNAGAQGVVYGGALEFELTLRGDAWQAALKKAGWSATDSASATKPMTFALEIGEAKHAASVSLKLDTK